ncbi:hypothetical protein DM01DRAFT_1336990 [Hesseltinella vesiculosa]|uniref:Ams2/SPT21 N-terminal domain-containing protein n=1 Tax=Hesseltinella vesiculosa TaxID=101127 RepID=A0A1X2GEQ0_9FUNG|nr:hypothetical protein DM01DRAFT_1336990 [Hesseltinella vesiculosa]
MSTSSPSMSISKMMDSPRASSSHSAKVKVYYTFKDEEPTCLCTFETQIQHISSNQWFPISLRQCLVTVCSSSPDQLMRQDHDLAIYSANAEESPVRPDASIKDVMASAIWEGHGLLSSLLNDPANEHTSVTGQLIKNHQTDRFEFTIQVLLQLHPVRLKTNPMLTQQSQSLSPPAHPQPSPPPPSTSPRALPPMRSLLAPDRPMESKLPSIRSLDQPLRPTMDFVPPSMSTSSSTGDLDSSVSSTHSEWGRGLATAPHPYEHEAQRPIYAPPPTSSPAPPHTFPVQQYYNHPLLRYTGPSSSTSPIDGSPSAIRKQPMDAFYHQSRRKKRDTKPPNANDVRPYVDVPKDRHGSFVLPVDIDSWTVLDLGSVIWDRPAFHNQRYIYPAGYCVKKWYRSMVDPHSDTQYTCKILDGGDEPIFQLEADDNPGEVWRGPTPTTVWTIAVRRAFAIRNMDYGHNPVGPDFFGLRKNTIAKMIQDLPNADRCRNYVWQHFEAINHSVSNKGKPLRRSNTRVSTSSSRSSTSSVSNVSETVSTPVPQPQPSSSHPSTPPNQDDITSP